MLLASADLVHMLWEADVLVFKAHITTSPDGRVADMFWIHDHRIELPQPHRSHIFPSPSSSRVEQHPHTNTQTNRECLC